MTTKAEYADRCLLELVQHIFEHRSGLLPLLHYGELAQRIGRVRPDGSGVGIGMGDVLGTMGRKLALLPDEWGQIPHIQSLVVSKHGRNKGVPDDGIAGIWPGYDQLTIAEKRHKAQIEYQKIAEFGHRWNDVLQAMELSTAKPTCERTPPGGGESENHRRLKEFVCANPEAVGLSANAVGIIEYPLPTLDAVDVLFKTERECVAIEVKSAVSDRYPKDYERGIFQVVKYRSLLLAISQVTGYSIPGNVDALLVLETRLPDCYRPLARNLEVSFLENVTVE